MRSGSKVKAPIKRLSPNAGSHSFSRITIPLPPNHSFVERLTRAFPELRFQDFGYQIEEGAIVTNLEVPPGAPLDRIVETLRQCPDVRMLENLASEGEGGIIRLVSDIPRVSVVRTFYDFGVVPELPIILRNGSVTFRFVAQNEVVAQVARKMQELFPGTEFASLKEDHVSGIQQLLTPRQVQIFQLAMESGYWDVPRRISLTELAQKLGLSKSSLSEVIAHIEKKLIYEMSERGIRVEA